MHGGSNESRLQVNLPTRRPVLITGGAGFIGTNLAHRLLSEQWPVIIFDNLSRAGVMRNLRWLRDTHGDRADVLSGDVRDAPAVHRAVSLASHVVHLAAQVAVSTSLVDPVTDFEINARGTVNLLEAIRSQPEPPSLVYTSTSKVYGPLDDIPLREAGERLEPEDPTVAASGISESHPLRFHGPGGCSRGSADQYVLDHARTFGLPALVFRLSTVYGPHQYGTGGQGWIAQFLSRALAGEVIVVHGDGRQVSDVLFVEDLVDALLLAQEKMAALGGRAYNIGGGPDRTLSPRELLAIIGELGGEPPKFRTERWRDADQRYFVSDASLFTALSGWRPRTGVNDGIARLYRWLADLPGTVSAAERPGLLALAGSDARG